jgi:hypothetical protein
MKTFTICSPHGKEAKEWIDVELIQRRRLWEE